MKNNKPDISLLRKYLNGELDARAMYEIERQAQDDPILMDVMLGMENGKKEADEADLDEIKMRIKKRTGMQTEERKNIKLFPWKTWMAAASLVFAFLMAGLWFFRTPEKIQLHQSAGVQQKPETEVLRKTDTANTVPEIKPPFPSSDGDLAANKPILATRTSKRKAIPEIASAPVPAAVAMAASSRVLKDTSAVMQSLDEVTVTGYAAAKKAAVATYSSQTIKADTLTHALTGKVAGLQVRGRASARVISGVVNDKDDHSPVSGAVVKLKGNGKWETITDAKGRFNIPLSFAKETLEVTAIGFDRQQVRIDSSSYVNITLEPNRSALSEVVVTGIGRKAKPKNTAPEIGWKAYSQYLEEQGLIQSGNGGKVTLTFTIDEDGKPVSIKILKGVNAELDQKAIRIVADGPKWSRDEANQGKQITLKVKFHQ